MTIVCVHGRAQGTFTEDQLRTRWATTLEKTIARGGINAPAGKLIEHISMPYYATLLDDYVTRGKAALEEEVRGLDTFEQEFAEEAAERLTTFSPSEGRRKPPSPVRTRMTADDNLRSIPRVDPEDLHRNWMNGTITLRIAALLDRALPKAGDALINRTLRDVGVYLRAPQISDAVDKIVTKAILKATPPVVVVAHSLGSIVAYNVVRALPKNTRIARLVTVGSPLGVKAVRKRISTPRIWPRCVGEWINAVDPRDIVALGYPIDRRTLFSRSGKSPAIEPPSLATNFLDIDNFTSNRHSIEGYLSDPFVAKAIVSLDK